MSSASAQYKKQDGTLTIARDGRTVSWKAANGSQGSQEITVSEITNLQQTPATAAKASVRISIHKASGGPVEPFTFTFPAREDQQAITATLRKCIEDVKAQPAAAPTPPAGNGSGTAAAMGISQTTSSSAVTEGETYDDSRLLKDQELQRSLLTANTALRQRFEQAISERPDTMTMSQLVAQFWSSRVHLLRSHAAERAQHTGSYNVLSVVKPKHVDGVMRLNMSKEQIQLIFAQHPLIKRVYNENVPPLTEGEFWSRFFNSRLCRKLKGLKITDADPTDAKLDRYLAINDDVDYERYLSASGVPHFIDLEGNEQNHSQKLGNKPDWTMQPNSNDKVPILRVLNKMSEKLLGDVPSSDARGHAPAGVDEETYNELQLRDLQRAAEDNRVILNVINQDQMFSAEQGLHTSSSAATYAKRTPAEALALVRHDFQTSSTGKRTIHLESAIGVNEDSSSDEESTTKKKIVLGSRSARSAATLQILHSIQKRHLQDDDYLSAQNVPTAEQAAKLGLSETIFEEMAMTHNTTIEFLHYFWSVFLSGDADRANEVTRLAESLAKSIDRINAVAEKADVERKAKLDQIQQDNDIYARRTGKKRKFDPNSVKGGKRAVAAILHPLKRTLNAAAQQYKTALEEQQRQFSIHG